MTEKFKFLHNSEIDLQKWDRTVEDAINSRVYAMSWYLDILNPNWHGLIYGNYQYVMPVVSSKKWGITYVYQPVYAQQHGVFPPTTPEITALFIAFLKMKFRYFSISFNSFNVVDDRVVEIENRKNFILSLSNPYGEIKEHYTSHTSRYVKKAVAKVCISSQITLEEFLKLKKDYGKKPLKEEYLKRLKLIISHSFVKGIGQIYGVYNQHNELCAAAFFIKEKQRFTYLNSVSSPEGKQLRAMYAIVDAFIRDHSEQSYLLDFEGSTIEGIARFFEGFGASPETYQSVKYNNLPWFLKLFKK